MEQFKEVFFQLFEETFTKVQGIYLDGGTSLFETLSDVTAEVASRSADGKIATLAAQVKHVSFYLGVLHRYIVSGPSSERVDWKEIWETTSVVTEEEWSAITRGLDEQYNATIELLRGMGSWDGERDIAGAMAMLVHTAYHLGGIRMALRVVR